MAVMPLPVLAMYFTPSELLTLLRAASPNQSLMFTVGPFVIGLVTLLGSSDQLDLKTSGEDHEGFNRLGGRAC